MSCRCPSSHCCCSSWRFIEFILIDCALVRRCRCWHDANMVLSKSAAPLLATTIFLTGCGNSNSDSGSTPKKAAMALAQAMQHGDAAGIKAASVGGDPQVIDALAASMAAHRALADAATAKFGAAAKGFDDDAGTLRDFAQRLDEA